MACKVKREVKLKVWARAKWRCAWCGRGLAPTLSGGQVRMRPNTATVDHLVPRSKGGRHAQSNLVASCFECNARRGDKGAMA